MAIPEEPSPDDEQAQAPPDLFLRADLTCTFGPSFFMGQLGRFVRDRCPDPKETLPVVEVLLADGDTLDVCHIIGVAPRWVVLAVRQPSGRSREMTTALVPYELVRRVCIRARRAEDGGTIGFDQSSPPEVVAPERLLIAAMAPELVEDRAGVRPASGQVVGEQGRVPLEHAIHAGDAGDRQP
jgi:hypothetical protein